MPVKENTEKIVDGRTLAEKYPHYWKKLPEGLKEIDTYWVMHLFNVQNAGIAHAIKKLLCPGLRHDKVFLRDLIEARDTLNAVIDMQQYLEK